MSAMDAVLDIFFVRRDSTTVTKKSARESAKFVMKKYEPK